MLAFFCFDGKEAEFFYWFFQSFDNARTRNKYVVFSIFTSTAKKFIVNPRLLAKLLNTPLDTCKQNENVPVLLVVLCLFFDGIDGEISIRRQEAVAAMKFMETTKMQNGTQGKEQEETKKNSKPRAKVFGRKIGLISRLIGCSHKNLSRPFIEGNAAYKSCLSCGARKHFDPETFESDGNFYYPPVN